MKKEIIVPEIDSLDANEEAEEVEISQWFIEKGQKINKGEVLVEVMVDKAAFEIESDFNGKIIEIKRMEGEIVKVGEVIAIIEVD